MEGRAMKLSKKGKAGRAPRSVSMPVDFWKTANGLIHLATNDPEGEGFHVAISNDKTKPNGHPTLYRRLDTFLRMKGAFDVTAS
jgi:hypothetical protein